MAVDFWLNLPIAVGVAALSLTRLRESVGPPAALDIPALALVTGAAFALVWGLVRGNSAGCPARRCSGADERRDPDAGLRHLGAAGHGADAADAALPLGSLLGRAAMFLPWGSGLGALYFMAQFQQTALGHGPLAAVLGLMPWGATTVFVPPIAGVLISRVGERPLTSPGCPCTRPRWPGSR